MLLWRKICSIFALSLKNLFIFRLTLKDQFWLNTGQKNLIRMVSLFLLFLAVCQCDDQLFTACPIWQRCLSQRIALGRESFFTVTAFRLLLRPCKVCPRFPRFALVPRDSLLVFRPPKSARAPTEIAFQGP